MVTEDSVVDGEERLLAREDNGKGGKVSLQPGGESSTVGDSDPHSSPWVDCEAPCCWVHGGDVPSKGGIIFLLRWSRTHCVLWTSFRVSLLLQYQWP